MKDNETHLSTIWLGKPSKPLSYLSPYETPTRQSPDLSFTNSSFYRGDQLIDGHLKKNWNSSLSQIVAINQIIIGLLICIIGGLMIFFNLALASTAHGVWTGLTILFAGFCAFFTSIHLRHRYFLFTALIHLIAGLVSAVMIFISALSLALQINNSPSVQIRPEDHQLNSAFHVTLIILGIYEKLLCYSFLTMLIRHTHMMI